ncbi:hypothetical protein M5E87_10135 [Flavonifractor plautii]|nr:hypothetical protein M5E87_10135 [Flavonifractor plautii]
MLTMAAGPAEVADSLYINGNIYTVDEDFSTATTMAVKGTASCMWATKPVRRPMWVRELRSPTSAAKPCCPVSSRDICMSAIWGKPPEAGLLL